MPTELVCSSVFTCIAALGTLPPAERGPSLESIYRVSLTVDLCEGNKTISCKNFTLPHPVGASQKEKKIRGPWARGQCADWLRRPCWLHADWSPADVAGATNATNATDAGAIWSAGRWMTCTEFAANARST